MMLDKIDFAWSLVLLVVSLVSLWKTYANRNQYWKTWPWHAALAIGWTFSVPLDFATGDTLFAWFGIGLSLLSGWNWFTHQDRAKREFESLRIDELPKN